jgi:hypothetical protein
MKDEIEDLTEKCVENPDHRHEVELEKIQKRYDILKKSLEVRDTPVIKKEDRIRNVTANVISKREPKFKELKDLPKLVLTRELSMIQVLKFQESFELKMAFHRFDERT